jgi:hypothetical protein
MHEKYKKRREERERLIKEIAVFILYLLFAIFLGAGTALLMQGCTIHNSKICLFENDQIMCSKKKQTRQIVVKIQSKKGKR